MTYIAICCDSKKVHASAGSEPSCQLYSKQAVITAHARVKNIMYIDSKQRITQSAAGVVIQTNAADTITAASTSAISISGVTTASIECYYTTHHVAHEGCEHADNANHDSAVAY
eukprot:9251-Heterococcus_DN1.PRE.3